MTSKDCKLTIISKISDLHYMCQLKYNPKTMSNYSLQEAQKDVLKKSNWFRESKRKISSGYERSFIFFWYMHIGIRAVVQTNIDDSVITNIQFF